MRTHRGRRGSHPLGIHRKHHRTRPRSHRRATRLPRWRLLPAGGARMNTQPTPPATRRRERPMTTQKSTKTVARPEPLPVTFQSLEPRTGKVIGNYPIASPAEVAEVV